MGSKKKKHDNSNVLMQNRKAFHDYIIVESYEAGLELRGTEVKSCRKRTIATVDAYVRIEDGEAILYNVHIAPYDHGNQFNHDPKRRRRLLLHKKEILKISSLIKEKGHTVIPLKFYLKRGRVKVLIGIAKGKTHGDKRDTLRKKQDERDSKRAAAAHLKR